MAYPIASQPSQSEQAALPCSIQEAQKAIYQVFWQASQTQPSTSVLALFRQLFIDGTEPGNTDLSMHLHSIVMDQHQDTFNHILRSVCYILVNTWLRQQHTEAIQELFELFDHGSLNRNYSLIFNRRLRLWLQSFQETAEFKTLKTYALGSTHWSQKYQAYLLVDQYTDSRNPFEHQESARQLAQSLKYNFQLQLAKYALLAQEKGYSNHTVQNPTILGDAVISLIKRILLRRDHYSYETLAARFRQQTSHLTYLQYKQELLNYLRLAMDSTLGKTACSDFLKDRLIALESSQNHRPVNDRLVMKTIKRIIDWLTLSQPHTPSRLFVLGACQSSPLAMVTLLLKLVLICPQAYTHLEERLAELIHCYEAVEEQDCQWFIHFLECFRITFAMFLGYQQYSLIQINAMQSSQNQTIDLNTYRIFAQQRHAI